jgi:3-deoxy-manno-octulosonate cytidylyltransferase (CMP-KDO synthetase)
MALCDALVVATDSEAVAEVCARLGAPVEMTSPEHLSGTDRVAEVAEREAFRDYGVVVNVQGDEPLLEAAHLAAVVELVRDDGWPVGTCASPLLTEEARRDPAVVKVVRAAGGRALYFSRASIPYSRAGKPGPDALAAAPFLRHVGLYAYARPALRRWVAAPPSTLEQLEMLEQLRALDAGLEIGVAVVGPAEGGVDTPADVVRVEARLREQGAVYATDA